MNSLGVKAGLKYNSHYGLKL